ncbi:MAG: DUF2752 domain-containing protein [Saprospiraceae bacterium]|nr:DUF2752 domain-containing protein [Saprospiraceae bacterium]MBK7787398.1 DUF2752 domain-containing protein [Saprospiraceae bacterium]MBK8109790.1 DUF2752 domain-containing protein [Saprospiraceae bacterium]MBL0083829.1 DUF2752 domain-containing protein [Saprospiraceae bacterium]
MFYTALKKYLLWLVVASPFILMLLPADFFDNGTTVCISQSLAGVECYGCGLTRATMHLLHFDFLTAWHFNKLVYIVTPLLFLFWLKAAYIVLGKTPPGFLAKHF